jgi:hypothetical protein
MATDYTISIAVGEGRQITYTAVDEDGDPLDLTNASVWFTVHTSPRTDDSETPVIAKRSFVAGGDDDEVELLDQTTDTGKFVVKILSTDTRALAYGTKYWFDVWVQLSGQEPFPAVTFTAFDVTPTVTVFS